MTDWLSTKQAAGRLGVSEASVRRWSDDGALPARRVGKRRERRFRVRDLEAFGRPRRTAVAPARPSAPGAAVGGIQVEVFNHLAAFYSSDAGRLRLTVPFLAEGLRAGQPCFLLARADERAAYLEAFSGITELDLEAALAGGWLVVADGPGATVEAAIEFWEERLWRAVETGAAVIRVVGEMASEREQFTSEREMLAYEAAINLTVKRFPCVVVCQYDVRRFSAEAMLAALRAHPDLYGMALGRFLN